MQSPTTEIEDVMSNSNVTHIRIQRWSVVKPQKPNIHGRRKGNQGIARTIFGLLTMTTVCWAVPVGDL